MNFQLAFEYETSGKISEAYKLYLTLASDKNPSDDIIRGLIRTTLRVGDVSSLIRILPNLLIHSKINPNVVLLQEAKLYLEIGETKLSEHHLNKIDQSNLSQNDSHEIELLNVNIKVLRGLPEEALEILMRQNLPNLNLLRRRVEIEILMGKPQAAIATLKNYVSHLNIQQKSKGKPGSFRTASGMLFNLANQIWLDIDFKKESSIPSLYESMAIVRNYTEKKTFEISKLFSSLDTSQDSWKISDWKTLTGAMSRKKHKSLVIEFLSSPFDKYLEMFANPIMDWERNTIWRSEQDYFFCEESGYISSSNFGLLPKSPIAKSWLSYVQKIKGFRVPDPIDLFVGGGILTRLVATELLKKSASPELMVLPRTQLRRYRSLPNPYSSTIN